MRTAGGPADAIVIANAAMRATILPSVGGSLGSLTWHGRDLLRAAPSRCTDPRDTACFPLVPFANRIAHGRLEAEGARFQLPGDGPAAPHALHGVGWITPWRAAAIEADAVELSLAYEGGDWPWRFEARQALRLTAQGLCITLELTNCDTAEMPGGVGFHPYFNRSPATRLHSRSAQGWAPDRRGIAAIPLSRDSLDHFNGDVRVEDLAGSDICLGGWSGEARIVEDDLEVAVTASSATPFLHLFAPAKAPFFCIEPVSHAPDAANRADVPPMAMLKPGATLCATMTIAVAGAG